MGARAVTPRQGRSLPFYFVDVFADAPLTGNPLAVVAEADDVDEEVMRAIAREFNQSETTFVLTTSRQDVSWRLRSFTPTGVEVGGAGHNALGAWWWLAASGRLGLGDGRTSFTQEIGDRVLPVEILAESGRPRAVLMEQEAPTVGEEVADLEELAAALGLDASDLGNDLPARVVSTGAPHLLVQARMRASVDRATPEPRRLAAVLSTVDWPRSSSRMGVSLTARRY